MIRTFKFDYDSENDDLFLYDPKSKSKASIELDDVIVDFNSNNEVSAIEIMNASSFLKDVSQGFQHAWLNEMTGSKVDIIVKENFLVIKMILVFRAGEIITLLMIPTITKTSPALKI
ncbi:MAG: DUF2283 domain-containing protein [Nanoarchaeota archaeon]